MQRRRHLSEETKRRISESKKGKPNYGMLGKNHSKETRKKMSEAQIGIQNHGWKGDKAKYCAIHNWIRKWKGQPDICEGCGKIGLKGRQINWANIDHKYCRVLEDYIRLCVKCHREYDIKKGFRKIKRKKI